MKLVSWNVNGLRACVEKGFFAGGEEGEFRPDDPMTLWEAQVLMDRLAPDYDSRIVLTEEKRVPCPELTGKALNEHANRLFQMYSGDAVAVKMRFHRSLINAVMDRFGRETMLVPDGEDHFVFTAPVAVSPMFLSWVIGFGAKAKILYPQPVADQCKALCQEVMSQY